MKKLIFSVLFGILLAILLCGAVFGAEIQTIECNKTGVMYPEGNDRIDEVFSFYIIASGDTEKILMNSGKGDSVVATNQFGNKGKDTPVGMNTGNFVSGTEGKRVFKFSAVGYDGTVTPYEKEVVLYCYKPTGGEKTVYSVEFERDVVKEVVAAHDTIEKIEATICTSLDVRELRLVTETGNVVDGIYQHCKERGSCDIIDGKKYWKVYFVSTILGQRSMSFQAIDNGVPVGDVKTAYYTVLSDEEWDMRNAQGGTAGSGKNPGTDEGFSSGDDKNATGNEDGVENGGNGQTDSNTSQGSAEKGESKEDSTKEPEDKEDSKKENTVTNPENKGQGTGEGGNCCRPEDFISVKVPASSKTFIIEFPDGTKYNAVDQEEKNLAKSEPSEDGTETVWDIWVGSEYEKEDVKITVYDEEYKPNNNYTVEEVKPFTDEETAKYDKAIENEIRILTNPEKMTINLRIYNKWMIINERDLVEIDPGRETTPVIIDGRTLLPVRAVVETLGGKIFWDESERRVQIEIFNRVINFYIDSLDMTWDNIPAKIDVAPQIINGRTMLPIRYMAEVLDHTTVEWNGQAGSVTITYNY